MSLTNNQHEGVSGLPGAGALGAGEAVPAATAQLSNPVIDQAGTEVQETGKVSICLETAHGDAQEGPLFNFNNQNAVGDAGCDSSRIDNDSDKTIDLTNRDDIDINFADITSVEFSNMCDF